MISSILDQRGFTGCQAGVLAEMERMLEDRESAFPLLVLF
jgi:hypothetical protein